MDDAKTQTYHDVERLILYLVHRRPCCGLCTHQDRISAASLAFVHAYNAYQSGKGKFSTLVGKCVCRELSRECRRSVRAHRVSYNTGLVEGAIKPSNGFWNKVDFLSKEARSILSLLSYASDDFIHMIMTRKKKDRIDLLRFHLVASGWEPAIVAEAFDELQSL